MVILGTFWRLCKWKVHFLSSIERVEEPKWPIDTACSLDIASILTMVLTEIFLKYLSHGYADTNLYLQDLDITQWLTFGNSVKWSEPEDDYCYSHCNLHFDYQFNEMKDEIENDILKLYAHTCYTIDTVFYNCSRSFLLFYSENLILFLYYSENFDFHFVGQ